MFRRHLRHLQEASCTWINSVKKIWNNQHKCKRPLIWAFWIICKFLLPVKCNSITPRLRNQQHKSEQHTASHWWFFQNTQNICIFYFCYASAKLSGFSFHRNPEHSHQALSHVTATMRVLAFLEIYDQVIPTQHQRSGHDIIIIIISFMELGHFMTRSGLTYLQVSSKVYHDSFCPLECSVSLPWVNYFEAFYLRVVSSFSCIPVICPKLVLFLTPLQFVHLFCNLSKRTLLFFSCISSLLLLFFWRHLL